MDWQTIILTLGASLITGAVSLIGNIIVSKSNLKKSFIENQEQSKKEYNKKRILIYDSILNNLALSEVYLDDNKVDWSNLQRLWLKEYHYCSKEVNFLLHYFFKNNDKIEKDATKRMINRIRNQIKKDIDSYYGFKENKKSKNFPLKYY